MQSASYAEKYGNIYWTRYEPRWIETFIWVCTVYGTLELDWKGSFYRVQCHKWPLKNFALYDVLKHGIHTLYCIEQMSKITIISTILGARKKWLSSLRPSFPSRNHCELYHKVVSIFFLPIKRKHERFSDQCFILTQVFRYEMKTITCVCNITGVVPHSVVFQ